jgi:hypothetical protein
MPDVVLVRVAVRRFAGFRVALIGQLTVAVDGMVAAPFQFLAYGSLPVPETPSIR